MKVLQVVAGLDQAFGGPSYSVPRLCAALRAAGAQVDLEAVGNRDAAVDGEHRFPQAFSATPVLRSLRASPALRASLRRTAKSSDILHSHGLWLLPNVYAGRAAAEAGIPLIVSPRGMLAPQALRFSPLKKRIFWSLFQARAYRKVACWHATSDEEADDIRRFGRNEPIAVVPNGVDLPERQPAAASHRSGRTVITIGRLHPKKGLDRLIEAWAIAAPLRAGWRLRIIGPGEGDYAAQLKALVRRLGVSSVSIEPAVYGAEKWMALGSADLFVLATLSENFGLAVAEALGAELPVICTHGAPWKGLDSEDCGWWIEQGIEPLAAALLKAMDTPQPQLRAMGARGRAWMERDFAWASVGEQMLAVYRWIISDGPAPSCVRMT